ncbi:MAG: hypothetical protein JWQ96_3308 [Segetibacter sp.]|nr:hypothetical protein [Segetibacter sp.]
MPKTRTRTKVLGILWSGKKDCTFCFYLGSPIVVEGVESNYVNARLRRVELPTVQECDATVAK